MAAITKTDLEVQADGDIRHVAGSSTHTVLELHRFLMDILDDQEATGDDYVDVTNEIIPSVRSTDKIVTLSAPYNIDDRLSQRFFGGSIEQDGGDELYSGLKLIASFNAATTEPVIIQNNKLVPNFWGTGINPDAAAGVIMQILVKSRTGGADIDDKKILVLNREWDDTWAEFPVTLGTADSVAAIKGLDDDFNETVEATIEGYTDIVNNLEGYQQIDLGDGSGDHDYFSEWDKGTRTLNDLYERAKFLAKRSKIEDTHTGTGKDRNLDNTYSGQAQSFTSDTNAAVLTRVRLRLKKTLIPTGDITVSLHAHSGTYGTSSVPGALLATSDAIDASQCDTAYREIEFIFSGTELYEMTGSTQYVIALNYSGGDASNYISVDGVDTTGHGGNASDYIAAWAADATDDLWFEVQASSQLYGMPGCMFRGITHELDIKTPTGTMVEPELMTWTEAGTVSSGQLLAIDSVTAGTIAWMQLLTGIAPTNNTVLTGAGSGTITMDTGGATVRNLSPNSIFLGSYTGAMTGAYGIGIEAADLTSADKLRDLSNIVRTPPNNQNLVLNGVAVGDILFAAQTWTDAHTVSGAYSIGDTAITLNSAIDTDMPQPGRVNINGTEYNYLSYTGAVVTLTAPGLVESLTGGEDADLIAFRTKQYTGIGNVITQAYIEVNEALETFDRSSGYIRIWDAAGSRFDRYQYDSYDTATKRYTLNTTAHPTGLDKGYTDSDPVFVPMMDYVATTNPESSTHIYTSDVTGRARVYDSGEPIVPAEVPFTFTSTGASLPISRNADA